ncbi:precorrin-6y C5,15-methyltransferase (decarboxylating) subunit CbiE [Vibrio tapetis]|uniref:Precorrin-6y methylase n=1 Tax=Vibrio tapetis subsp. tapetis TaxID=1671868 RepID=A0A2N8ZMA5_9VIBR|nr:precorrin-6y C5,15-methyltransferase (decarboxylating) subunit CbiE [Vibrio tapetis]SON53061.1 Precorrin-6y methylase [Vibrio tapetis subsp. tapetis]
MVCIEQKEAAVTVIGVPEDGCLSLTSRAVNRVEKARVLAGNTRLLEWFPQFKGTVLNMEVGFSTWLAQVLEESEEGGVVVLASGDPLFFGIGSTLLKRLPNDELRFIPSPSSMQLACSRIGLAWQDAKSVSLHGRSQHYGSIQGLSSQMQQGDLFCLLTDKQNHPARIANHLLKFNNANWQVWVAENLGGTTENISEWTVSSLAESEREFDSLNVVILKRHLNPDIQAWGGLGQYASDDDFEKRMPKRGLITKQSVRHLALCSMRIKPTDVVWDIGTGSGSVAIEAAKQCAQGQVFTLESNPDCYPSIEANIQAHSTDNVTLVKQKAPLGLDDLPQPSSVFIGGSRGQMDSILDTVWQRLANKGVLVASAVTVDSVSEIYSWAKRHGVAVQVQLVSISNGVPLAHYTRYQADNPIHLFIFNK